MKKLTIIDYGSGNLHSIAKACEKAAIDLDFNICVSDKVSDINNSTHIILPGVGAFFDCMSGLKKNKEIFDLLNYLVLEKKRPFLGICVGMQLVADLGTEDGNHEGFGWIPGKVVQIKPDNGLKIPHMGWNELQIIRDHKMFNNINDRDHVYFTHSYHFICDDKAHIIASCDYGTSIAAAIAKDNIWAVQFHPEKSQNTGIELIKNFLKY